MQFSKIKKLNKAELLKNEGKYKEAFQLLNNLEENANLPPQEKLTCQLLKSTCLNRLGQEEDALKLSKPFSISLHPAKPDNQPSPSLATLLIAVLTFPLIQIGHRF